MLKGFGHCYVCERHTPPLPSTASPWRTNTATSCTAGRTGLAALQQALGVRTDGAERGDGALSVAWLRPRQAGGLNLRKRAAKMLIARRAFQRAISLFRNSIVLRFIFANPHFHVAPSHA